MTTNDDIKPSLFVYVKDGITGTVTRVAVPADLQIGMKDKPQELHLMGRLSLNVTTYDINGIETTYVSNNDTIVLVNKRTDPPSGTIEIKLPSKARTGQLYVIKDSSGTAGLIPVVISATDSGVTIDGASSLTLSVNYSSAAVFWNGEQWSLLVSGGTTSSGGGSGDPGASYLVIGNTGSLSNERAFVTGTGLRAVDGGANSIYTLSVDDNVVAMVSGTTFTGPIIASGGLTGSLQNISSNLTYLAAGQNITIVTQSNGQIVVSATGNTFPKLENITIVAGIFRASTTTFQAISAFELNIGGPETMIPSGSTGYAAYFQPLIEIFPSGALCEVRLWNITTLSAVTNSSMTGSSLIPERLKTTNLTGSFATGSNIYEVQIRLSGTTGTTYRAICKGARLVINWN